MDLMARRLVPAEDVKTITVDESVVLADQRSGQYFALNETGAAVWRHLENREETASIVETIIREYDVSEDIAVTDVQRILSELLDAGLIR